MKKIIRFDENGLSQYLIEVEAIVLETITDGFYARKIEEEKSIFFPADSIAIQIKGIGEGKDGRVQLTRGDRIKIIIKLKEKKNV